MKGTGKGGGEKNEHIISTKGFLQDNEGTKEMLHDMNETFLSLLFFQRKGGEIQTVRSI